MTEEELLAHLEVLKLEPGDKLLFHLPSETPYEFIEQLSNALKSWYTAASHPESLILVGDEIMVKVVRSS